MGNGFLGEHGGKGILWWHENHGCPFLPSTLITTSTGVQQEETKESFSRLQTWGEPALVLVRLTWVGCSHVQDICKLGVSRSPVFNYVILIFILTWWLLIQAKLYYNLRFIFVLTTFIHFD